MKKINYLIVLCLLFFWTSCTKKQYKVFSVEGTRVEMDSTWNKDADPQLVALVNTYKAELEAKMNIKIGTAVRPLIKNYPQGLLSNFTADAIKAFGEQKWGNIDFAIMNNGGIRANLNEGDITVGNIFEIYPFDNQIVLLELPGKAVNELFSYLAVNGGEALSEGICFVIQNKTIKTLLIGNKPFDENKNYRVATIDFLAEGNSGMTALKQAVICTDSELTLRDMMIGYVKEKNKQGQVIDAELDNRISIE
jgi:5''-nucleotidase/2'',3''-cyclic phosphodiesterase and related esterases